VSEKGVRYDLRQTREILRILAVIAGLAIISALGYAIARNDFQVLLFAAAMLTAVLPACGFASWAVYYVMVHPSHLRVRTYRTGTGNVPFENIANFEVENAKKGRLKLSYHLLLPTGGVTSYTIHSLFRAETPLALIEDVNRRVAAARSRRNSDLA